MSTMSIQAVIERIRAGLPDAARSETVDTVKAGDPSRPVTGIVTTFLATSAVLARAVELGANLVITHEPIFYEHRDDAPWLMDDPVVLAKRRFIDRHGLTVFRLHDQLHGPSDAILAGFLAALGWQAWSDAAVPAICTIPVEPLDALAGRLKAALGADSVRVAGPPEMPCRRVALVLGACGGKRQIGMLARSDVDAVVCGEINEWETCEYVRDAVHAGMNKGLLVVGHAASEEAGMAHVAAWLGSELPGVTITHVPAGEPLRSVTPG